MIDFKKEEKRFYQIQLIKSALADFRAYDVIRQAHIDLMYHFGVFFIPTQKVSLNEIFKVKVLIDSTGIGYQQPYEKIAHLATDLWLNNQIQAKFTKEYTFQDISFRISDYLAAPIPEEEMLMLELLGKVDIQVTTSTTTKSVFCST